MKSSMNRLQAFDRLSELLEQRTVGKLVSALYRAFTFHPTVVVTKFTIAVVVGAIMLARIGSFDRRSGEYGNGSNEVTF
jgi:hypothetical protein